MKGDIRERANVLFDIYDLEKTGGVNFSELLKIVLVPLPSSSAILSRNSIRCSFNNPSSSISAKTNWPTTSGQNIRRSRRRTSSIRSQRRRKRTIDARRVIIMCPPVRSSAGWRPPTKNQSLSIRTSPASSLKGRA